MMRWVSMSVALLVFTSSAFAEDWPAFRGPRGDGHAVARTLPTEWSDSKNVTWKVALPGEGWSSPVVVGGKVYVTAAVVKGDDLDLRLMCLDAATGRTVWDEQAFHVPEGQKVRKHRKATHANPTPIVEGQRVYVHFGHNGTAAFDLAGKAVWRNSQYKYNAVHGNGGSPILVDDLLVFSVDGGDQQFVVALNKKTGKQAWKTPRNTGPIKQTFSFSTPTLIEVDGRRQIVSPGSEFVMAYDPKTGRELWRVRYPGGYSVIPKPVYAGGLLYVCSGYNTPSLLAIRPTAASKGDITPTAVAWTTNKAVPHTASLLLVADRLYMVSDKGGIATCLDARTGSVHWAERLGGNFSASPIYADGKIYFLSEEGLAHVLKPGETFEVIATSDLGERTLASPAVVDGTLFIRGEKHLFRIEHK